MKTQIAQDTRKITGIASKIPGAVSNSVYAIYTEFENEGKNNDGQYTFLIGMEIDAEADSPKGLHSIETPSSRYHVFEVEAGKPEKVFDTWMEIWSKNDLNNSYKCDFEEYRASGEIAIYIGSTH